MEEKERSDILEEVYFYVQQGFLHVVIGLGSMS
jgi:hypothetical protein